MSRCVLRVSVVSLLLFVFATSAKVLFHSNFENERTYTATALKPGAKKIELLPSPEIEQWFPETGGEAIIEPNYQRNREVFRYTARKGAKLIGIQGLTKPHARYVAVRSGGIAEWYNEARETRLNTHGHVRLEFQNPLAGSYSAGIDCKHTDGTILLHESPYLQHSSLNIRFLARFSPALLENPENPFPLLHAGFGKTSTLELVLGRYGPRSNPIFRFRDSPNATVFKEKHSPAHSIVANKDYAIEFSATQLSGDTVRSLLWLDGKLLRSCFSTHATRYKTPLSVRIGKLSEAVFAGILWLDEIVISDTIIGPILSRPIAAFSNGKLTGGTGEKPFDASKGVYAQWQIASQNSWLLPAYNSGKGEKGALDLDPPHFLYFPREFSGMQFARPEQSLLSIPAGEWALARFRYAATTNEWSSWSNPIAFEVPPPPPTWEDNGLRIHQAHFTLPGKRKHQTNLKRQKWYDLHFAFTPTQKHAMLDVFLCGNPENMPGSHLNRGGVFQQQSNYVLSLSFPHQGIWCRETEGTALPTSLIGKKGRYCDDRKGISRYDYQEGTARIRIRILEESTLGTWKLAAYLAEDELGVSPLHQSLFFVEEADNSQGKPEPHSAIFVTVVIALCAAPAIWLMMRRRSNRDKATGENGIPLASETADNERAQLANEFILANYTKPISLQDVADEIHVSTNWLCKLFKAQTGKNVVPYINELRINKAQKLLRETNLKINEIAFQTGFNSAGNFNATFNRIMGISPRDFRKQTKAN